MITRRRLGTFAALTVGSGLWPALAHAFTVRRYSPAAFASAQENGRAVALHFHADWCPTCRLQQHAFAGFLAAGRPKVELLIVPYDQSAALREAHRVKSQSTVVVFRGTREVARLAGVADPDKLRAALDAAP